MPGAGGRKARWWLEVAAAIRRLGVKRIGYDPARDHLRGLPGGAREAAAAKSVAGGRAGVDREAANGQIGGRDRADSRGRWKPIRGPSSRWRRGCREGMKRAGLGGGVADPACGGWEPRSRRSRPSWRAGARSALPHAQPTGAPLRKGDLVVVDMGAFPGWLCQRHDAHAVCRRAGQEGEAHVWRGAGGATGGDRRGARGRAHGDEWTGPRGGC